MAYNMLYLASLIMKTDILYELLFIFQLKLEDRSIVIRDIVRRNNSSVSWLMYMDLILLLAACVAVWSWTKVHLLCLG